MVSTLRSFCTAIACVSSGFAGVIVVGNFTSNFLAKEFIVSDAPFLGWLNPRVPTYFLAFSVNSWDKNIRKGGGGGRVREEMPLSLSH